MIRYCREDTYRLKNNSVAFRISAGILNSPTGCTCDILVHTKSNLWILSTKMGHCDCNSSKEVRYYISLPLKPPSCPHDIQEKGKSRRKRKNEKIDLAPFLTTGPQTKDIPEMGLGREPNTAYEIKVMIWTWLAF